MINLSTWERRAFGAVCFCADHWKDGVALLLMALIIIGVLYCPDLTWLFS